MKDTSFSNRLAGQSSPYLLSHAENPVNWFPWGSEALEKARTEDKPIFLSIGYSACHWCHVMAHESFEDRETADILNRYFVSIKVDREERPDLDSIYMNAVQIMTGSGGWPLSVFLFPDGTPFYGGTYFPPQEKALRYGMTGFPTVLLRVAEAFRTRREELLSNGEHLLSGRGHGPAFAGEVDDSLLSVAFRSICGSFDRHNGGFGGAPKFPMPMILEFLLRFHAGSGDEKALQMAETTLVKMASGGICDQIAGGFHRYSIDEKWLVPHFEKMLYDNALLAGVYTEAFQLTGNPLYRRVAEMTLDYLIREMRHPQGGFCSAQDADSAPVSGGRTAEGAFYTWSREEVMNSLGSDGKMFCEMFDVTEQGNYMGGNILHLTGIPEVTEQIDSMRKKLVITRDTRPKPFRDEKIIASWNGMAIRAFAAAAGAFSNRNYLDAAASCAEFSVHDLMRADGRILRWWKNGIKGLPGFLEDYSLLAGGYLELYRTGGDESWLDRAASITDDMISLFLEKGKDVFHDTGTDHEVLFTRPRDSTDSATPSGTSAAVEVLLKLSAATGNDGYQRLAETVLASHAGMLRQSPLGFGRMLCAAELCIAGIRKVVIAGESGKPDHYALLNGLLANFHPHALLIREERQGAEAIARVCLKDRCLPPVTDPEELASMLEEPGSRRALQETS